MNDADLEMLELEAVGDAIWKAERTGRCCHSSAVSYRSPAYYPEQEGLRPGQLRCRDCHQVFLSDADWDEARVDAIDL